MLRSSCSLFNCSGKNTITTAVAYKRSTESSYTTTSVTFSSGTAFIFGGGNLSTDYSYDIRYTLTDAFGSIIVVDSLSTASVLMDFKAGGTGIGVGKVAETDNLFDVGMNAKFRGTVSGKVASLDGYDSVIASDFNDYKEVGIYIVSIVLTRDLNKAKKWVREQCQGTTRYGLLASSGALRLKPEGIFVKNEVSVANWFLNGKDDVRSSYYLEDVVSEFDIQGLELDYSIVAWDADFRFDGEQWGYYNFSGSRWMNVTSEDRKLYLKNAYRVLLTRARQGIAIFIPEGSDTDHTRKREYYDRTYEYLRAVGVEEI